MANIKRGDIFMQLVQTEAELSDGHPSLLLSSFPEDPGAKDALHEIQATTSLSGAVKVSTRMAKWMHFCPQGAHAPSTGTHTGGQCTISRNTLPH